MTLEEFNEEMQSLGWAKLLTKENGGMWNKYESKERDFILQLSAPTHEEFAPVCRLLAKLFHELAGNA